MGRFLYIGAEKRYGAYTEELKKARFLYRGALNGYIFYTKELKKDGFHPKNGRKGFLTCKIGLKSGFEVRIKGKKSYLWQPLTAFGGV